MSLQGRCFCGAVRYEALYDPERVPPAYHAFVHGRLSWLKLQDDWPQYAKTRAHG